MSRACAFLALLDEFGVCGTRSKNEKTHKGCELKQVLAENSFHGCDCSAVHKGSRRRAVSRIKGSGEVDDVTLQDQTPYLPHLALDCIVSSNEKWAVDVSHQQQPLQRTKQNHHCAVGWPIQFFVAGTT